MEFIFDTVYNQKAVTTMAKALRKTLRKKRSRRSHRLGWIVVVLALLLTLPIGGKDFTVDFRTIITWIATFAILIALLFEDGINGYIARKRMLVGTGQAISIFNEENYCSESDMGRTEWRYENIRVLAETKDYFVFLFDMSHAQVYDKNTLTGGTVDAFRQFIIDRTGKEMQQIK